MFSFCRLCANCKDQTELTTDISELLMKLFMCCGWNASENETKMPSKACDVCVEELERSWRFAENIKAAESKLNKLISEQKQIVPSETTSNEDILTDSMKSGPDICSVEIKEFEHFDNEAIDDTVEHSDAESLHSIEDLPEEVNKKSVGKKKPSNDPFLAQLDDEDRLTDGTISANGVSKLEKLFPEMKAMSWADCEYKCQKCNRTLKGPHNFHAHNRSIHTEEMQTMDLSCFYCESTHKREFILHRHITEHFSHLKFRCWYCTDYFWDTSKLNVHRDLHTNVEYKCELCDHIALNRDQLYQHISYAHQLKRKNTEKTEAFTCDICSKDFATKWSIKIHMMQHYKKYDYVCDQCGGKFITKNNLKEHLLTHSMDRNFVCPQCNSRFKTKACLKVHMKTHEDFKPFGCELCDKRFFRKNQVQIHMRSHTDTRPYSCKFCEKTFRHLTHKHQHERIHTNEKPYACDHPNCGYRSPSRSNLKKHLRIHSKDK